MPHHIAPRRKPSPLTTICSALGPAPESRSPSEDDRRLFVDVLIFVGGMVVVSVFSVAMILSAYSAASAAQESDRARSDDSALCDADSSDFVKQESACP